MLGLGFWIRLWLGLGSVEREDYVGPLDGGKAEALCRNFDQFREKYFDNITALSMSKSRLVSSSLSQTFCFFFSKFLSINYK